jgi:hypothetical protein
MTVERERESDRHRDSIDIETKKQKLERWIGRWFERREIDTDISLHRQNERQTYTEKVDIYISLHHNDRDCGTEIPRLDELMRSTSLNGFVVFNFFFFQINTRD